MCFIFPRKGRSERRSKRSVALFGGGQQEAIYASCWPKRYFFPGGERDVVRRDYETVWEHCPFGNAGLWYVQIRRKCSAGRKQACRGKKGRLRRGDYEVNRGVSGFYDPAIRLLSFISVSRRREKKKRLRRDARVGLSRGNRRDPAIPLLPFISVSRRRKKKKRLRRDDCVDQKSCDRFRSCFLITPHSLTRTRIVRGSITVELPMRYPNTVRRVNSSCRV